MFKVSNTKAQGYLSKPWEDMIDGTHGYLWGNMQRARQSNEGISVARAEDAMGACSHFLNCRKQVSESQRYGFPNNLKGMQIFEEIIFDSNIQNTCT